MTYLFSNPQVKKWKTLFMLSLALNIILVITFLMREREVVQETGRHPEIDNSADVKKDLDESAASSDEKAEKNKVPERKKIPEGEHIIASVTVEDSFFEAFKSSEEITKLSEESGISNLSELLSAHIGRLLIWDLVIRSDVRKGDRIDFMFRIVPAEEKKIRNDMPDAIEMIFLAYHSKKFNKNIQIFRFKKDNAKFSKYYYADASGIEKNIVPDPPIKEYIQVTSIVGDRSPRHEGVDFKALAGTPVFATVDGTVLRKNWMMKYNGYCVEIREKDKPVVFKYLHLGSIDVVEGQKVKKGEQIALSGNTGKTTAPHLHYQINAGSKGVVVDPFKHHKTVPEILKGADLEKFKAFVVEIESTLK
ncbi:MAG TPA: M23 family metallopeptidase [bacterium]|nr:M23 family metallopeptidase [bacterium]HPS29809.1 M23 family metallopeptidase [bacterium]